MTPTVTAGADPVTLSQVTLGDRRRQGLPGSDLSTPQAAPPAAPGQSAAAGVSSCKIGVDPAQPSRMPPPPAPPYQSQQGSPLPASQHSDDTTRDEDLSQIALFQRAQRQRQVSESPKQQPINLESHAQDIPGPGNQSQEHPVSLKEGSEAFLSLSQIPLGPRLRQCGPHREGVVGNDMCGDVPLSQVALGPRMRHAKAGKGHRAATPASSPAASEQITDHAPALGRLPSLATEQASCSYTDEEQVHGTGRPETSRAHCRESHAAASQPALGAHCPGIGDSVGATVQNHAVGPEARSANFLAVFEPIRGPVKRFLHDLQPSALCGGMAAQSDERSVPLADCPDPAHISTNLQLRHATQGHETCDVTQPDDRAQPAAPLQQMPDCGAEPMHDVGNSPWDGKRGRSPQSAGKLDRAPYGSAQEAPTDWPSNAVSIPGIRVPSNDSPRRHEKPAGHSAAAAESACKLCISALDPDSPCLAPAAQAPGAPPAIGPHSNVTAGTCSVEVAKVAPPGPGSSNIVQKGRGLYVFNTDETYVHEASLDLQKMAGLSGTSPRNAIRPQANGSPDAPQGPCKAAVLAEELKASKSPTNACVGGQTAGAPRDAQTPGGVPALPCQEHPDSQAPGPELNLEHLDDIQNTSPQDCLADVGSGLEHRTDDMALRAIEASPAAEKGSLDDESVDAGGTARAAGSVGPNTRAEAVQPARWRKATVEDVACSQQCSQPAVAPAEIAKVDGPA